MDMNLNIDESLSQPWGASPLRPPTGDHHHHHHRHGDAAGINVVVDEPFSSSVTIGSVTPARNTHSEHKLPHSPGAQMLLNAAGVVSPRSLDLASFPASMLDSPGDIFAGMHGGILPPSPAMTPSRLFLSENAPPMPTPLHQQQQQQQQQQW